MIRAWPHSSIARRIAAAAYSAAALPMEALSLNTLISMTDISWQQPYFFSELEIIQRRQPKPYRSENEFHSVKTIGSSMAQALRFVV
jgi:hypothetical protein